MKLETVTCLTDSIPVMIMDGVNQMKAYELRIQAVADNLPLVQSFVEEYLEVVECPLKAQMQISVAVEEIFVNIVSYAYGSDKGDVIVCIAFSEKPAIVTITFRDYGIPYDPLTAPDPDVTLSAHERGIGGLGIFMTKKLMDNLSYEYRNGQNILQLQKKVY